MAGKTQFTKCIIMPGPVARQDWNTQNNLIENALKGIRKHQSMWNVPVFAGEFRVFDFYGLWEKFKKINLGNGTFVLQAMVNQMYVWVTPLF